MRYLITLLAAVGLVVSVLSLRVHYSHEVQICDINAHWDCGIVNHSRYAEIKGIPVAALGIVGYTALILLGVTGRLRIVFPAAVIGLAFAVYLSHIEADVLQVWCLYCVISQIMIALIFVAVLVDAAMSKRLIKQRPMASRTGGYDKRRRISGLN